MKTFSDFLEGRCWPGHKPVPGKKPFSPGSCMKEDDMEEDWSQEYKSSIDCNNPKGFSQKAHCAGKKKNESVNEDLRNWFDPNHPKGGWKRVNSKGEVVGDCAREPGEPKPKCMSNAQRASLSKKEKASAVRRKRKEDPNPERQGEPINVKSKVNENMEQLDEKNKPTNPELWSRAIAQAKSKFDVYPSAYANGWAAKWYKEKGGGWKSVAEAAEVGDDPVNQGTPEGLTKRGPKTVLKKFKELSAQVKEAKDEQEYGYEGDMALNQLATLIRCGEMIQDMLKPDTDMPEWVQSKITLATDYIQTAADYLYSEMKEEVQIDELSSDLLGRYKTAAGADASKADKAGDYNKGNKRFSGIMKATKKQFANDMKKEEIMQEGRPSQRHPLEGHEYHKKTDAELVHIAKDAHAAAEAMKSHNTTAENKYRDQANDSATVRHFRKTSGTPDWYKKKYGHMKETFKPMDEPNYNNSIEARQKKADNAAKRFMDNSVQDRQKKADNAAKRFMQSDNKPPFDGPYKKSTGVVTDKSGAKHGGMSIARNLAKQAMKKQASKMSVKEGLEESRKAEIVKEIMKKGKKKEDNTFQAEPEITTTVVKADN